jgi:hypothetical protein
VYPQNEQQYTMILGLNSAKLFSSTMYQELVELQSCLSLLSYNLNTSNPTNTINKINELPCASIYLSCSELREESQLAAMRARV